MYTQLTDVEGELNGLITYDRRELKLPAEVVARMVHMPLPSSHDRAPQRAARLKVSSTFTKVGRNLLGFRGGESILLGFQLLFKNVAELLFSLSRTILTLPFLFTYPLRKVHIKSVKIND